MAKKESTQEPKQLRITQVRSGIGHPQKLRDVLASLGLRHHQASVVQQDTPQLRGAIKKVRHLVTVAPVKE